MINKKVIFTSKDCYKTSLVYGNTYTILDYDKMTNSDTGEITEEIILIIDDLGLSSWVDLKYFNDINELRLLKLERILDN